MPPPARPTPLSTSRTAAPAPAPTPPVVAERTPRFVTPESVAQRSSGLHSVEPPGPLLPWPFRAPVAAAGAPAAVAERPTPPVEQPGSSNPNPRFPGRRRRSEPGAQSKPESTRSCASPQIAARQPRLQTFRPPRPAAAPPATARQARRPQAAASRSNPSAVAGQPPTFRRPPHDCAADWPASGLHRSAAATAVVRPRSPSAMDNRTGLPVRGQPIFQRPRPGQFSAPAASGVPRGCSRRASAVPSGRAPSHASHPHRAHSGWPSPDGWTSGNGYASWWSAASWWCCSAAAAGAPPPGATPRPGARAGAPARRPGQRYQGPRGKQEGPMKGFTPPPRLSLSNEPMPITRAITISEGVSVKDLAEKLGHPRQGSDCAPAGSWRLRHHQPDAQRRPRPRHGPPLRSRELGHQL